MDSRSQFFTVQRSCTIFSIGPKSVSYLKRTDVALLHRKCYSMNIDMEDEIISLLGIKTCCVKNAIVLFNVVTLGNIRRPSLLNCRGLRIICLKTQILV